MTSVRDAAAAPQWSPARGNVTLPPAATYYTVSDRRFFVGTVLLLNALRVSGNSGGRSTPAMPTP